MAYASKVVKLYLVTNTVTGKSYVGITAHKNVARRFSEHWYAAHKKIHNGAFYRALIKYPRESFQITVIAEYETRQEAYAAEIEYIAVHKPEYNSTLGGDGHKGKNPSPEEREKNSLRHKGNKYHLGKNHSEETKQFLKELAIKNLHIFDEYRHLGPKKSSKPVICINDGILYESASSAARHYGVAKSGVIEICLGKPYRKSIGGLTFKYAQVS